MTCLPFKEARKIVSGLGIKTEREYKKLARSGMLPKGLPVYPYFAYHVRGKKGWAGWQHFLGKTREESVRRCVPFQRARAIVSKLGFQTKAEYKVWAYNKDARGLPKRPDVTYGKSGWVGWAHFLGTAKGTVLKKTRL